ncbi:MAG TPA: LuxR C-terminal-related transcriptional regulator [Pirellulaceae bacterium]|jgi:DNA-binding NarL/FixJ family response regulator|nr:LuxR C-terminal-related transcriptional regulator [Pirellulaceae bacterium]
MAMTQAGNTEVSSVDDDSAAAFDESLVLAIRRVVAAGFTLSPSPEAALEAASQRAAAHRRALENLSPREREVYRLIGQGRNTKQIAVALAIGAKTVEYHRQNVREKLGLRSGADVTRHATTYHLLGAFSLPLRAAG